MELTTTPPHIHTEAPHGASSDPLDVLWRHHAAMTELLAHARTGMDISSNELAALMTLRDRGPLTMGELGNRIPLSRAAMTTLIDRLVDVDYVRRMPHGSDRRRIFVELTERFDVDLKRHAQPWLQATQRYVEAMSAPQWQLVQQALGDLHAITAAESDVILVDIAQRRRARVVG